MEQIVCLFFQYHSSYYLVIPTPSGIPVLHYWHFIITLGGTTSYRSQNKDETTGTAR